MLFILLLPGLLAAAPVAAGNPLPGTPGYHTAHPPRTGCTAGACHQEIGKAPHVHAPVEDGCLDCHDPRATANRFLLQAVDNQGGRNLCFTCHEQENFSRKYRHAPVSTGDCLACHDPHGSANPSLLVAPSAKGALCFQCHQDRQEEFASKFVHAPARKDCTLCHDPHSSDYPFQLRTPPEQLCAGCHRKLNPEIFQEMAYPHPPVAENHCLDCHQAHASNIQALLKKPMEQLCFTCHTDLADRVAESRYRHGPVKAGDCTVCHRPHGSRFSRLLVRDFPTDFYVPYKPGEYDLCFGCHIKNIAKLKHTTSLTSFRDGDYNLHYFHVNRKKGRSCIACHDPHASNQPKHIRYEVPFGSWSYPISFTRTATGGTCIVGCHGPKTYDRKHPRIRPSR